MDVLWRDDDDD